MRAIIDLYSSSLGKKVIVALTGLVLFGFVVGHMMGNLKAFAGLDTVSGFHKLDMYAVFLKEIGQDIFGYQGFLWLVRVGLLGAVVLHIVTVIQLQAMNRGMRPEGYHKPVYRASSFAARTMFYGGIILAIFIVFHILHFTTGHMHFYGFEHGAVYANVYSAFSRWYLVLFYTVAMLALAFHTYHGVWSMFQTLGLNNRDWNPLLKNFATVFAVVLFIGFLSVPFAIFFGILPEPV